MGKIRVRTFGDEELELKNKEKQDKKKEAKKAKEIVEEKTEDSAKQNLTKETALPEEVSAEANVEIEVETKAETHHKKEEVKDGKQYHSKKYLSLSTLVNKSKIYSLSEALKLLSSLQRKTIDETVELHINTVSTGISGNVTLPHGTGKKTRVVIADDAVIAEIEKGKIDFDILLAEPSTMVKLAKVAKILGPRGLMPNPKNGTVTANPTEVAKKYEGGQVNFKTEKAPILHLVVGKMSFGDEKLSQNIESMLTAVKKTNIVNVTLKSTMSPGIKIKA